MKPLLGISTPLVFIEKGTQIHLQRGTTDLMSIEPRKLFCDGDSARNIRIPGTKSLHIEQLHQSSSIRTLFVSKDTLENCEY